MLRWLRHLGGPGLMLLGLLDNSLIPVPGSMDALTIVLAAAQQEWWPYYALMATIGALIGGYLTYRLAQKGGNERLKASMRRSTMAKVERIFARWGFGAIAVAAILPPPVPMVPFLVAAGATRYSRGKFLAALAVGRSVRYSILAFLGATYGRRILSLISHHGQPIVILIVVIVAAAACVAIFLLLRRGKARQSA
ncbi:MAG TPA: VTT domain-containing protein [Candidatus Acidoferrum sp.]|nr:VTT domain-containing protein [Candidatus Acidoferrum sp.]